MVDLVSHHLIASNEHKSFSKIFRKITNISIVDYYIHVTLPVYSEVETSYRSLCSGESFPSKTLSFIRGLE